MCDGRNDNSGGSEKICHNPYDGRMQSVGLVQGNQVKWTCGVFLPGEHVFDNAKIRETIHVTHGAIEINGVMCTPESPEPAVVEAGGEIVMIAATASSHLCFYG